MVEDGVLFVPPRLSIESRTSNAVTLFDSDTGRRLKVSAAVYALMRKFRRPTSITSALNGDVRIEVVDAIERLVGYGFLAKGSKDHASDIERLRRTLQVVSPTIFRAPATGVRSHGVLRIIGVPYDGGNVLRTGARAAPDAIRRRSCEQQYRIDVTTGEPVGWFEVETAQRLLEGVTISDDGNVRVGHGEDPALLWQRLAMAIDDVLRDGAVPFVVGGDHSVSFASIDAVQRYGECVVVWCDAHTDCGALAEGRPHSHRNVVTRINRLPNVLKTVVVGHRGYTTSDKISRSPEKVEIISAAEVRKRGADAIVERLPDNVNVYVSIDVDVLDPIYLPATSTPLPGGLTPTELKEVLRAIGASHRIRGADMVELNPDVDAGIASVMLACHLMIVCLAAAAAGLQREASRLAPTVLNARTMHCD